MSIHGKIGDEGIEITTCENSVLAQVIVQSVSREVIVALDKDRKIGVIALDLWRWIAQRDPFAARKGIPVTVMDKSSTPYCIRDAGLAVPDLRELPETRSF